MTRQRLKAKIAHLSDKIREDKKETKEDMEELEELVKKLEDLKWVRN
jgi:peptidoglycan hydrolase CwlO-like protein